MQITQFLKRAVQINPEGIATVQGNRQQTWLALYERVQKLAGALKYCKLSSGGRVAILSLNNDRYVECYFAVPWAGGVIVPLNARLTLLELAYVLNNAEAEILMIDTPFLPILTTLREQVPSIKEIIFLGDQANPVGTLTYETLIADSKAIDDSIRSDQDLAGIFYTGGTTGLPKGVMLSNQNLVINALHVAHALRPSEKIRYLYAAPVFHVSGSTLLFCTTLSAGTHFILPQYSPEACAKAIQDYNITTMVMTPAFLYDLVYLPQLVENPLKNLQQLFYGGGPVAYQTLLQAKQVLPNCKFGHVYGMTESSGPVTFLHDEEHPFSTGVQKSTLSVGKSALTNEIKIIDEQGKIMKAGQSGQILFKGPNIMTGYWKKPQETEEALKDGWMHSGDIGYLDEQGFLYLQDRMKDMIVRGGSNIYSIEVENALNQHPAVAMSAVIGITDEKWGETVHAIVVPKPGHSLNPTELIQHCKKYIAEYKCPETIEIRSEPLPISAVGKVLKAGLRAEKL